MLTEEQKKEYLENSVLCPFCKSDDIETGQRDFGNNQIWQNVWCHDCGKRWQDIYTLTNVEEDE